MGMITHMGVAITIRFWDSLVIYECKLPIFFTLGCKTMISCYYVLPIGCLQVKSKLPSFSSPCDEKTRFCRLAAWEKI